VQATIAARIDRLDPAAKRTLTAASVIGSKFSRDLLEKLGIDPILDGLLGAELIDQVTFTGDAEYVFHHPLIRTVAYESQLKSDRAELHRRLATEIEARSPVAADENAALIAEHLEAAGDGRVAYGWHLRAASWARISGVLTATDLAIRDIEDALQMADRSSDNFALALVGMTLGLALVHRPTDADRDRGEQLLTEVRETFLLRGHNMCELQLVNVYLARERARRGDHNDVVPQMRDAVDDLVREGRLLAWGIPTTGVLVETLLDRGAEDDVAEAETAVERLAAAPSDDVITLRGILLLRLRALLGRAHGDADMYYQLRDRYGDMAKTLGFEGHIAWAETMQ
jgi:hypothetical protein